MIKEAGAKEIHMLIASPPTISSCFYGVDTPDKKDLIAANCSISEIAKIIGVNSLAYISIDGLYKAIIKSKRDNQNPQYCDACFTGEYPIHLSDQEGGQIPLFDFAKN